MNKDFYHLSAGTIEVKSNTPNNVAFKVTGKSSHDKATSGAVSQSPIYKHHNPNPLPPVNPEKITTGLLNWLVALGFFRPFCYTTALWIRG